MNDNFGILKELGYRVKGGKIAKYEKLAERSLTEIERLLGNTDSEQPQ
jgi:folate-dependent tRNA-U54 methylase TrmFO/GidA